MAVIEELITRLGFELTDRAKAEIKAAEAGFQAVSNAAFNVASAVADAATDFGTYIKNVAENAAEMERMSKATGQSTTQLQEWSYAATKVGADASVVQGDLASLQQKFEGMSIDEIANKLSSQFAGMSEQQKRMYAQSLSISMDTVGVFEQDVDGIAKLKAEGHAMGAIIPESAIKAAAAFDRGLNTLQMTFRSIADQVAMGVTPKLLELVEATQKWLSENQGIVQDGLAGVLAGIGDAFDIVSNAVQNAWNWFKTLLPSTDGLANSLFGFENVAKFVRAGLVLLAILLAPLIIKFLLIAAAVTAVVLVFSDLMEAFRGGNSVIGGFIENVVSGFQEKFPNISKAIGAVVDWLGTFFTMFASSEGDFLSKQFDALLNVLGAIGDWFMNSLKIIDDFIAALMSAGSVKDVLTAIFDTLDNLFLNAVDLVKNIFTGLFDPFKEDAEAAWAAFETIWNNGVASVQAITADLLRPFDEVADAIKKFSFPGALDTVINFLGGKDVQDGVQSAQQVRLQMGQIPVSANNSMANDNRQMTQHNTYNVTASPESVSALSADMERLAPSAPPCAM